jgi:hypothetical protein
MSATSESELGVIRAEALFSKDFDASASTPVPLQSQPGPVLPDLAPMIAITAVNGAGVSLANDRPISEAPQGAFGEVDITVDSFDPVMVGVRSENVPGGTTVQVAAKPKAGGMSVNETGTLGQTAGNCDGSGACTATIALNLAPGTYFLEAQATFETAMP